MNAAPASRFWIFLAGVLGATGVGVAAWSSHGLPAFLPADQLALGQTRAQAANLHLLLHTVVLFGIGLWVRREANPWAHLAGLLFVLGILGFAGGIYVLRIVLGIHDGALIRIVPAGGLCLIAGWLALAIGGLRRPRDA